MQVTDSADDDMEADWGDGGSDGEGESPQTRQKRGPAATRGALVSGAEAAAAAAGATAVASAGGGVGGVAAVYAAPADAAKGAAEGASPRMLASLKELNLA